MSYKNEKNVPLIYNNADFLKFVEKSKISRWEIFILFRNLRKFIYTHNFSKKEVFEIFEFFKFDKDDAIEVYVRKSLAHPCVKAGNLTKLKESFIIFMQLFDHFYRKDIIDFHHKLDTTSDMISYYNFVEKVEVYKGWSGFLIFELLGSTFSMELLYHAKYNKNFFVKVGVFSIEVKKLLIDIINIKELWDGNSVNRLDSLIKELRSKANISFIHIIEILTCKIICIIDLDINLQWDSSDNPITIDYYENNSDPNIRDFNKAARAYHDNFLESYRIYLRDFQNHLIKYDVTDKIPEKSSFKDKVKKFVFSEDPLKKDTSLLDNKHILSIDSPNKEKLYHVQYYFTKEAKSDFYNLIISKYSPRLFRNKNKFVDISKKRKNFRNIVSKYEEDLEGYSGGYFFYDLAQEEDQKAVEKIREESDAYIKGTEKKLRELSPDNYDDVLTNVIFDSFNYLKFFYSYLKDKDVLPEELMILFNSSKYFVKKKPKKKV